jgi:hypothetical protein
MALPRCVTAIELMKQLTLFQKILYGFCVPTGHSNAQAFNFLKLEDFNNYMADVRTREVGATATQVRTEESDIASKNMQTFLTELFVECKTMILEPSENFNLICMDN